MTTKINMLAIDLEKGSFQVRAVGPEGTVLYNRGLSRTRLAALLAARPLHRRFGLLLRGLEHALGQFGIFQGQVELVGRQLLGAFAEFLALRHA